MLVGVPKEIKTEEYRVGLVPGSVRELAHHGHGVIVESGAGAALDDHPMAVMGQLADAAGDQPDTIFLGLDLLGNADEHDSPLTARYFDLARHVKTDEVA